MLAALRTGSPTPTGLPASALTPIMTAYVAQAGGVAPHSKLVTDSFLRVVGARDMLALGDCSLLLGNRLPATAQVRERGGGLVCCGLVWC